MQTESGLDLVFSALSDRTRRAMLARLVTGDATISELSQPFAMSKPAISKHIKILERAGLIEREIDGRVHHCTLAIEGMRTADEWMAVYRRFWTSRFDALENLLAVPQKEDKE